MDAPLCSICLSDIESVSNTVTTECGHSFHCACLMQNVLINGFSCPCCRATMAQRTPAAPVAPVAPVEPLVAPLVAPVIRFSPTIPLAPVTVRFSLSLSQGIIGGIAVLVSSTNMVYNPITKEEIGLWKSNDGTETIEQYDEEQELWIPVWFAGQGMPVPTGYLF